MRRSLLSVLCVGLALSLVSAAVPTRAHRVAAAAAANPLPAGEGEDPDPAGAPRLWQVGLVVAPGHESDPQAQAFAQVLAEEGFPYTVLTTAELADEGAALGQRFAALIFPDGAARHVPPAAVAAAGAYVRAGGHLLAVFDAGTEDAAGRPLPVGALAPVVGVEYRWPAGGPSSAGGGPALPRSPWVIPPASPLRARFDPPLFTADHLLHPPHTPHMASLRLPLGAVVAQPLAYTHPWRRRPVDAAATWRPAPRGGGALYVNAPLGMQKVRGNDDLLIRGLLRHFLLDRAQVPRLVPAPGGVGGLVLDLHLCSGVYFPHLDRIFAQGLLDPALRWSIHVTAGPDDDRPGDGRGVGVGTPRGDAYLRRLAALGEIGSQGGWMHNFWALNVHRWPEDHVRQWLERNIDALAQATGRPVREYSAAGGAHRRIMNDVLAERGVRAVAVPLAWNGPPTHGWWDGQREDRFWVFPYSGTRFGSAVNNMRAAGRMPPDIARDLIQLIEAAEEGRQIRHLYFHPDEIARFPRLWRAVQGRILAGVRAGRLTVQPMGAYAAFLERHRQARLRVLGRGGRWAVDLAAPGPLDGFTVALPAPGPVRVRAGVPVAATWEAGWAYVTLRGGASAAHLEVVPQRRGALSPWHAAFPAEAAHPLAAPGRARLHAWAPAAVRRLWPRYRCQR